MENAFSPHLIARDSLRSSAGSISFGIRLPWYRSLPLSVVEIAAVHVDGKAIEPGRIRLAVDGVAHAAAELPGLTDAWWFVLDDATLSVDGCRLDPGGRHIVSVRLNLYPPYIPHLIWVTDATAELEVRPAGDRA